MPDQPMQTNQRYLTFIAMKPAQNGPDQTAFLDMAGKVIEQHGGISRKLPGNILHAVFGLDEENPEYHALAACMSAQRLQGLQACHIAMHGDYLTLPAEVRDAGSVLVTLPAQATLALCNAAESGQTILSAAALKPVQNQALTRTVTLPFADNAGFGQIYVLRKIIGRNTPLFYLRHTLNQPVPLVGRDEEFQNIVDIAEECFQNQSMHLHIEGEAGSGKTRLLYAVIDHLSERQGNLNILASPSGHLHANNNNPIQEFLCDVCDRAGFTFKNRGQVRDAFIPIGFTNDLYACAYLDAHRLPGISGVWAQMTQSEQQFFQAELAARIAAYLSHQQPLIILFDDVHKNWGYKQVLVQALRNNFEAARMLVLSISKKPGLFKGAQDKIMHLRGLPHKDIHRIASTILSEETSLQVHIDEITARANGNPYFAIQLGNHLKKEKAGGRDYASRAAIPESLDSLFTFQIQQMDQQTRDVLSCCAVLGQKFATRPIYKMLNLSASIVTAIMHRLESQGFLHLAGNNAEVYEFTHDLAQECIYRALPKSDKMDLHRQALTALRHTKPGDMQGRLTHMAHHAFHADMYGMAYACAFAAGMIDLELCIPSQAEENMSLALISLRHIAPGRKQDIRLARTLLQLSKALSINGKPKESLEVLRQIPSIDLNPLFKQQKIMVESGNAWTLCDCTYEQILSLESQISLDTRLGIGNGLRCAGMLSDLGYFAESNQRIAAIYPMLQKMDRKGHFGMLFPAESFCLSLMSRNHAEMGDFNSAHIYAVDALESIEHLFSPKKVYALAFSAVHYQLQGQHDKALPFLKEGYFLAKEFQIGMIYPYVSCSYAYSLYFATKDKAAFPIIRKGLEYAEQHDFFVRRSQYTFQYAEMLDDAGQKPEAAKQALRALKYARQFHEKHVQGAIEIFLVRRNIPFKRVEQVRPKILNMQQIVGAVS